MVQQIIDDLPCPLSQLIRRALNATTAHGKHQSAYYVWELAVKLIACSAASRLASEASAHQGRVAQLAMNLQRPTLGQWLEMAIEFTKSLSRNHRDSAELFNAVRSRLADYPAAMSLDGILAEELSVPSGKTVFTLLEKVVAWRTVEIGHGASGMRHNAIYAQLSAAFVDAACELLSSIDVLAGHRLVFVVGVDQTSQGLLVDRYCLHGEHPVRADLLYIEPDDESARICAHQAYLVESHAEHDATRWHPLAPLVHFDLNATKLFVLNGVHRRQLRYLCYTSGDNQRLSDASDLAVFLSKFLDNQVPALDELAEQNDDLQFDDLRKLESDENVLGEYRLLSVLGRGGMGVVYRALQQSLNRQVAVKKLSFLGNIEAQERFRREIETLGRADHPNLVKIFSSDTVGEVLFFSMELLEGCDLGSVHAQLLSSTSNAYNEETWRTAITTTVDQQHEREVPVNEHARAYLVEHQRPTGSLAWERAPKRGLIAELASLMSQVARAAHALHEIGVIHRDIKPENIMLSADGKQAVLMDLGIAKLLDESDRQLTRTTQFVGTLRYASPEQVAHSSSVDCRSDIYSIGAAFWELFTLKRIHASISETPDRDLWARVKEGSVENSRRHNPRIPADLSAIIQKCLAPERLRRYQTARELADDLDRFLEGKPVGAQPPSVIYHARKFAVRNAALVTAAAAVMIAALTIAIGYVVAINRENSRNRESIREKNAILARNHLQLAESRLDAGRNSLGVYSLLQARELLADSDPTTKFVDRMIGFRMARLPNLLPSPEPISKLEFSGDSTKLVFKTENQQYFQLWDVATGLPLSGQQFPPREIAGALDAFALDSTGSLLAMAFDGGGFRTNETTDNVYILRTSDWSVVSKTATNVPVRKLRFLPDDQRLNLYLTDGNALQWRFHEGIETTTILVRDEQGEKQGFPRIVFYFSSHQALFCRLIDDQLSLHDAETGEQLGQNLAIKDMTDCVPGDAFNVICLTKTDCRLWDPSNNEVHTIANRPVPMAHFSPDLRDVMLWGQDLQTIDVKELVSDRTAHSIYTSIHRAVVSNTTTDLGAGASSVFFSPSRGYCVADDAIYDVSPGVGIPIQLEQLHLRGAIREFKFDDEGSILGIEIQPELSTPPRNAIQHYFWDTQSGRALAPSSSSQHEFGRSFVVRGRKFHFGPRSELLKLVQADREIDRISVTDDHQYIAIAGNTADGQYGIQIKNASGETVIAEKSPARIEYVLSPQGGFVLLNKDHGLANQGGLLQIRQIHAKDAKPLASGIRGAILSYDGTFIAGRDDRGSVIIWERLGSVYKSSQLTQAMDTSFIGIGPSDILLAGAESGSLILWDLRGQVQLTGPYRANERIRSAAVNEDLTMLAVFSGDKLKGEIWRLPKLQIDSAAELQTLAIQKTKSRLVDGIPVPITFDEWLRAFPDASIQP